MQTEVTLPVIPVINIRVPTQLDVRQNDMLSPTGMNLSSMSLLSIL
jgi:hypothetical protein